LLLRGSLRANVLLEVIGILGVPASQLGIRVLLAHRTVGIQQPLNGRLSISVLGREIQAMLTGIVEDRGVLVLRLLGHRVRPLRTRRFDGLRLARLAFDAKRGTSVGLRLGYRRPTFSRLIV